MQISDHRIGQAVEVAPLPPFTRPEDLLIDALPLLDPPSRISVTDAAERYMRLQRRGVWDSFDREVAPYMVEPADMAQSRRFKGGAFCGPAQAAKTISLVAIAMHAVTCDPSPVQIVHMNRKSRNAWVEESLNPIIQNSPRLKELLGQGRDDDTFERKRFKGMRLFVEYPTAQVFSSVSRRLMLMTDYDHFPQTLGMSKDAPEGSPFDMAIQRLKTFRSRGYAFAESTPAYPVIDPTWCASKAHPHEMPPCEFGIVPLYNRGTRGRLYWECRDCEKWYEPSFDRLRYNAKLPPLAAGETAEMECPHCGSLTAQRHKMEMNRAILKDRGGWLHEVDGEDVDENGNARLVSIHDTAVRSTEVASWSMNGTAAVFANWVDLVARAIEAQYQLDELNDDTALGRFYYTDLGMPYARPTGAEEGSLTIEVLKAERHATPKGVAPAWVRFVVTTVDVQKARFVVQVTGYGLDGTRTVIDRFDLFKPPLDAGDQERALSPAMYPGDWAVLTDLAAKVYRVEGAPFALRPIAFSVDFQGEPGVSDNAEAFWKARAKEGDGGLWFLTRGHGGFRQRDRVWHMAPERTNSKTKRRGLKLLNMATDQLKDTVTAALTRPRGTPSSFPLPEFIQDHHLGEFCAEVRTGKGWEPKPGQKRNESLDLSVMAQAVAEHKGLRRINKEAPPEWALLGSMNPFCIDYDEAAPTPVAKTSQPAPTRSRESSWIAPRSDWINR